MVEWDIKKAASIKTRHGISFEEAGKAFFDSNGIDGEDIDHSTPEARRFRLAQSAAGNIPVIAYTLRNHGDEKTIRVISARLANRKEKKHYQEAKD